MKSALSITAHAILVSGLLAGPAPLLAEDPARGLNRQFEVEYLKFIIDHHYSALRMTELAAGTDLNRDPAVDPEEGTAPTPGTRNTEAKSVRAEIKSMARRNNRMQREEILQAQDFLRDWYGIQYRPRLRSMSREQIALLERVNAGDRFDHLFLEVFSRHHYMALLPSTTCQVAADLTHEPLRRYCSGIVHSQINDVSEMREMLCEEFSVCDLQPTEGLKGRHSGGEGQKYLDNGS